MTDPPTTEQEVAFRAKFGEKYDAAGTLSDPAEPDAAIMQLLAEVVDDAAHQIAAAWLWEPTKKNVIPTSSIGASDRERPDRTMRRT